MSKVLQLLESDNEIIQDKHGNSYKVKHSIDDKGRHIFHAYHDSNPYSPAAKIEMKRGNQKAMYIGTASEHRRKGLMSSLHDHAEKHLGHKIEADWATTPDGAAFYSSR
jgi:hypothetical protein